MPAQPVPPRSRTTVTRQVDGEFVVLDTATGRALCLAGASADAWRAAGTVADVDPDALTALLDLGLLDAPGLTRRGLLKRTGIVAAGVGIASIALPMASAAASTAPSAGISPASGPQGQVITVTGSNFAPNTTFFITFDGVTQTHTGPTTTTATGAIPAGVTFVAPNGTAGAHTVVVQANAVSAPGVTFTITALTITSPTTASPQSIANGSTATFNVTGTGFAPNAVVTVASNPGDFSGLSFTVTNSTTISVTITATNGVGHKGTANLTVTNPGTGGFTATATKALVNA